MDIVVGISWVAFVDSMFVILPHVYWKALFYISKYVIVVLCSLHACETYGVNASYPGRIAYIYYFYSPDLSVIHSSISIIVPSIICSRIGWFGGYMVASWVYIFIVWRSLGDPIALSWQAGKVVWVPIKMSCSQKAWLMLIVWMRLKDIGEFWRVGKTIVYLQMGFVNRIWWFLSSSFWSI